MPKTSFFQKYVSIVQSLDKWESNAMTIVDYQAITDQKHQELGQAESIQAVQERTKELMARNNKMLLENV